MKDLFVPKAQSIQLKELGFDEPCLAFYNGKFLDLDVWDRDYLSEQLEKRRDIGECPQAPTFSQAFKWFREKYNLYTNIDYDWNDEVFRVKIMKQNVDKSCNIIFLKEGEYIKDYDCFEEAELACIEKLIEITLLH